jgi:hypothetical protein
MIALSNMHFSGTTSARTWVADTKTAPEEEFLQCHPWTVLTSMVHALKMDATLLSHNDNIFKLEAIITIFCKN